MPRNTHTGQPSRYSKVSTLLDSFNADGSENRQSSTKPENTSLLGADNSAQVGLRYLEIPNLTSTPSPKNTDTSTLTTSHAKSVRTSREQALKRLSSVLKNDRTQTRT